MRDIERYIQAHPETPLSMSFEYWPTVSNYHVCITLNGTDFHMSHPSLEQAVIQGLSNAQWELARTAR